MRRPSVIPMGSWPRRMPADLAAGYCGETTVEAFIKRVGSEYPQPRITEGRRRLWLRDDLDLAILPPDLQRVRDVAEDLRLLRGLYPDLFASRCWRMELLASIGS